MDTYWLEGIRESIEEKPEDEDKNVFESGNKFPKPEDSKSS